MLVKSYKLIFIFFCSTWSLTSFAAHTQIEAQLAALEKTSGGQLGVAAINTANNTRIQYHANERFPFCSTSKFIVVAAILKKSMTDKNLLQEKIMYTQKDLDTANSYSPVTQQHLATGMTISELCAAAILSDSTAMNILVQKLGGPKAINKFAYSIGDKMFRLDRYEPELNTAIPGDARDTTSPNAMANDLQKLVLGNVLAAPQRELLQTWMKANNTGDHRIRAGVPQGWVVGDKTGSGHYGVTNDIAVIWPPSCPPIILAIYFRQSKQTATWRDDVISAATRIVINDFKQADPCYAAK